tara:strand:- start:11577 stop:12362 length:786 start_codon:yes stop_codon:yes gene_type:complete
MTTVLKRNKWQIWRDVIFALFEREIRTGFNDKLGLGWAIVNPIAFIIILSIVRGSMNGAHTHTLPTFFFMAYGLIFIQTFMQTLNGSVSAIKKNKSLFAFRQVQPISAVIAAGIFEILVKVAVIITVFALAYFMNFEINIDNPLLMLACIFLLWWFSLMAGLLFGILTLYIPEVNKLLSLITRPLFFISGTFFSLQDFPKEYWYLLDWNPILHAIELTRSAAYSTYGQSGVSLAYLSLIVLSTTFLALSVYHISWKQAVSR